MSRRSVVGLDLSLTSTGFAWVKDGRLALVDAIKTTGKKGDTLVDREARLSRIVDRIEIAVLAASPELVVVEAPSYGSTMGAQHDRSGLWWLVVDKLFAHNLPVATVSPNGRAKYGTGKGNAAKDAVMADVVKRYGQGDIEIKGNDQADAVILAAMGSRHLGAEVEVSLPLTHLSAMDGAYWPTGLVLR